ncbi:MAG: anaerobic ribonucleoside-triphosphate reductase activating protein [Oscillospiraceae bacterium]
MNEMLKIAGFVPESITDGPGVRFVVFCQGCPHHCNGCHNPETWDFDGGKAYTVTDIFEKINKNPLLSGVTFSGGEPFCQADGFVALAKLCKEKGLEIALYTGYTLEKLLANGTEKQKELLSLLDVMVDGQFELAQRSLSLKFYGSRNQRVLDVPVSLEKGVATKKIDGRWNVDEGDFPPVNIDYKF